jgi:hypothetical protein
VVLVEELLVAPLVLVVELPAVVVGLVVDEPKVAEGDPLSEDDDPSSAQAEVTATSAISRAASKRNMNCDRSDAPHSDDVAVA